jgi:hypothetical protein
MSTAECDLPAYGDPSICVGVSGLPLCTHISVEIARQHEKQVALDFLALQNVVPGSDEWADARRSKVGASEAAAVFPGVSITTSTQELHAKLRGDDRRKELSEFALGAIEEGREMEAVLMAEFKHIMRNRVVIPGGLFARTENGITLGATPDALLPYHGVVAEFKWRLFQCDWDGGLGATVFCQVQQQMHVTRTQTAYVYCGCRDGRRSMWIVHYSPTYMQMWWTWMNAARHLAAQFAERPRAERGIKEQLLRFIRSEVRQHSARVLVQPPPPTTDGASSTAALVPAQPPTPVFEPIDTK